MDKPKSAKKARAPRALKKQTKVTKPRVKKEMKSEVQVISDSEPESSSGPLAPVATPQDVLFKILDEMNEELRVTTKEKLAELGISSMEKIHSLMRTYGKAYPECNAWADEIGDIIKMGKLPRILIGLLGYTGSGKSSLINALIEEELVLSCNAMRASTSVVVEVSWNESMLPEEAYRAEISFVTADEWMAEFEILTGDIKGSSTSADAAMAFAKLEAVYAGIATNTLLEMSPKDLSKARDLSRILGQTVTIQEPDAETFYEGINSYIDSSNKDPESADTEASARVTTYWPLVRVVKLFIKADVLKNGLVLVDLPGLGDSNAGRTQVTENYIKNLNHMWVIADIVRAIDDQVARDLMGRSFKRQLVMNGKYDKNFVTFVMTKTDQVNNHEVISSLNLRKTILSDILREEGQLKHALVEFHDQIEEKKKAQRDIRKSLKLLSSSDADTEDPTSLKRKFALVDDSGDNMPSDERLHLLQRLNEAENEEKILRSESAKVKKALGVLKVAIRTECITSRNLYTQKHLRADFENGQQEFEDELADNEEKIVRVAHAKSKGSLETFCVSAKAYQKLKGRFKRESKVKGFPTIEHTNIPSLQRFAHQCTLGEREATADRIRTEVSLLNVSMRSWAETGSGPSVLSEVQRDKLKLLVNSHLEDLKKSTSRATKNTMANIRNNIKAHIESNLVKATNTGSMKATVLSKDMTTRDIAAMTWKAICRRKGVAYINTKKDTYSFNEEFLEIFLQPLTTPWKDTFQAKIPQLHQSYSDSVIQALQVFQKSVDVSVRKVCGSYPRMQKVLGQVPLLEERIRQNVQDALKAGQNHAKDAHGTVGETVKDNMLPCWERCTAETGTGMMSRLKSHVNEHIKLNRDAMYNAASKTVMDELLTMTKTLQQKLASAIKQAHTKLLKDVNSAIAMASGAKVGQTKDPAKEKLRLQVIAELDNLTALWEQAVEASEKGTENLAQAKTEKVEAGVESEDLEARSEEDDSDSSASISSTGDDDEE